MRHDRTRLVSPAFAAAELAALERRARCRGRLGLVVRFVIFLLVGLVLSAAWRPW